MSQKAILSPILLASLLSTTLSATTAQKAPAVSTTGKSSNQVEGCGLAPRPCRLVARHIEGNGIGYNTGYTTVEGFFAPFKPVRDAWVPFLDLRGHIFNNSKVAANAGLGLRYLDSSWVWGINAYYDYRRTKRHEYNQATVGLEALGTVWDFRISGYLPFGGAKTNYYDRDFHKFQGNSMIVSRKREFAMKGANAEAGWHFNKYRKVPMYVAAGPYYLEGQGKVAWGGQLRASVDFWEYFRIEGNTSYDKQFNWIGQGQLSVMLTLGKKRNVKQRKSSSCGVAGTLYVRSLQKVDRLEIIPIDHKHKKSPAINPATGQPYFFWFVNNTSHSAGTFESPFPTLSQAQTASSTGDVIYVFPGDGTTTGMDQGITLKNNQQLLGSGTAQSIITTVGEVTIPAQTPNMPIITNNTKPNGSGVDLDSNNVVSGIYILSPQGSGISGSGITNATIINNVIVNANQSGASDGADIFLFSASATPAGFLSGNFLIQGNSIIADDSTAPGGGLLAKGILIDVGLSGNLSSMDVCSVTIQDNDIFTSARNGIEPTAQGASNLTLYIDNNNILRRSDNGSNRGVVLAAKDASTLNYSVTNNHITSSYNTVVNLANRGPGFLFTQSSSVPANGSISGNTIYNCSVGARIIVDAGTTNPFIATATVNDNTFYGNQAAPSSYSFDFNAQVEQSAQTSAETGHLTLSMAGNSAPQWGYVLDINPSAIPGPTPPSPQLFFIDVKDFSGNTGLLRYDLED